MSVDVEFSSLRAFARHMVDGDRLLIQPRLDLIHTDCHGFVEVVLYRTGRWQAELVVLPPDTVVPQHRHNRAASFDMGLGNVGGVLSILGQQRAVRAPRGPLSHNLVAIPRGAWHGGTTGPQGAAFLSFQEWQGEPGWLTDDWQAHTGDDCGR